MSISAVIVTQDEPFFMPQFYEVFFDRVDCEIEIQEVVILDTMDDSFVDLLRRAHSLFGTINFVKYSLKYVRRKIEDRLGFDRHSVESIAGDEGIDITHRTTVNSQEFINRMSDVDVILSVSAPEIFDASVLDAPKWGCVNVHTSELPKYRGMLPTFWAMYHQEDELGVTVHTMAETVDTGEIVTQITVQIPSDAALVDVIRLGKRTGGQLAADALGAIADGTVETRPMEGKESYFSFPSAADRREFERKGGDIL